MKVAFLLGSAHIGGGTYVIFQHALYMRRQGWSVTIVSQQSVSKKDVAWHPEASEELIFKTFSEVADEEFDIAIATWWRTVYWLHLVHAKSYQYFVQSIESRFFEANDHAPTNFAEATYCMKLPSVTEASWIQKYLSDNYGTEVQLAINGIRKDIYTPDGPHVAPRQVGRLRVLVEGPLRVFFKNTEKTIELCKKSRADEIWLLTSSPDCIEYPGIDRTFSCVPVAQTADIYRSCDVIIKLSYVEGMFGPPLEMFHCGGTAIVYDVTGHEEYIVDTHNALVIERDDEEGVIQAINHLRDNPEALQKLKDNALRTSEQWPDWPSASKTFMEAIEAGRQKPSETRLSLRAKSRVMTDWYEHHVRAQTERGQAKDLLGKVQHELHVSNAQLSTILNSGSFKLMQTIRERFNTNKLRDRLRSLARIR